MSASSRASLCAVFLMVAGFELPRSQPGSATTGGAAAGQQGRRGGAFLVGQPVRVTPLGERAHDAAQLPALLREAIFRSRRMIAVEEPLKNSFSLEPFESLREEVGRDAPKRLKQVAELPTPAKD